MGTGAFKALGPFGEPHVCVFYSFKIHWWEASSLLQVCRFPHHTSMKKPFPHLAAFRIGCAVHLGSLSCCRHGQGSELVHLHSPVSSISDGSSHNWRGDKGNADCNVISYYSPGEPQGRMNCAGCRYYLGMLIERWIVKSSCVKWWHGAKKQTQSEKQVPTQEAKLEIISYYHFQEREQIKTKQKIREA